MSKVSYSLRFSLDLYKNLQIIENKSTLLVDLHLSVLSG